MIDFSIYPECMGWGVYTLDCLHTNIAVLGIYLLFLVLLLFFLWLWGRKHETRRTKT